VDVTQGLTTPLSAQAPGGPVGTPGDGNSEEANSFDGSSANEASGNFAAEVGAFVAETVVAQLDDEGASDITDTANAGNPGGGGAIPVSINDVINNFAGFNNAQASFAVNQNGIAFNFQLNVSFLSQVIFADWNNITVNGVHDFGPAFANTNFSELPGGLVVNAGLPDSVSPGSDGSCNQCTLAGAMFAVDQVTGALTFDNGGASVGSEFNGATASGTGTVTGN
jgi:hypothetical protein